MADAAEPDEVERLRAEVERLRAVTETLERRVAWRDALRRAALVLLLVLGCGLAGMSAVAIWTRATALDTDRYVETMAPVGRSPAVQDAVADRLYRAITTKVDFDGLARQVLPDRADLLAPAITSGLQSVIRNEIDDYVHGPRFPQLWNNVNRRAHETVVGLLTTGKAGRLELLGNTVYLDLSEVIPAVKQRLRERGLDRLAGAIPARVDGKVPLLSSGSFKRGRAAIHRLERLSVVLPILAIGFLLAHIVFSGSRRRGVLRVALGLALTALLLLGAIGIARTAYLDAIDNATLPREAAADIVDALIVGLREGLRIAVVCAVVLAGLSLLAGAPARRAAQAAGPRVRATAARLTADPHATWVAEHRRALQWSIVLLGGLVLVAWDNPTAAVVAIDAALIAVAVWLVAALARGGHRAAS